MVSFLTGVDLAGVSTSPSTGTAATSSTGVSFTSIGNSTDSDSLTGIPSGVISETGCSGLTISSILSVLSTSSSTSLECFTWTF